MFPLFCVGTRTTRFLKLSFIIVGTTEKGYKSYSAMTFSNTIFLYPNIKKWVYHFSNFKINLKNCHKKCKKYFLLLRQLNNILKKLSLIIKGTTEKVHKSYGAMTFSDTIFLDPNIKKGVCHLSNFKIKKVAAKNVKISLFMFPFFCFGTITT
jgi:hypothetical protein